MPTVFLLDASLSMERMVENSNTNNVEDNDGSNGNMDSGGGDSLLDLSRLGVSLLLEHFELNLRMEQAALITFGSRCEVLAGFSRDFSDLRSRLALIAGSGSTLFAPALHTAVSLISEATGGSSASSSSSPSPGSPRFDLVVVTDGGMGRGPDSIRPGGYLDRLGPLGFRGRITVVCLCHPDDPAADGTKAAYEKIIGLTGLQGEVIVSDCAPTRTSVEKQFRQVIETQYHQYVGTLRFGGELSCKITLCPSPEPFREVRSFEVVEARVSDTVDLLGFLSLSEAASPPVTSRHLVLPWTGAPQTDEDSRSPNLCVFLHGALKVESMCALVRVSAPGAAVPWFGLLYSYADTKKKSSLMLSLLSPPGRQGPEGGVPWLGDLRQLGPLGELSSGSTQQETPFPVRTRPAAASKPSYSASPVVWIKQSALHSDVQKILRHARKLPDKTPHFYKELNRLKRNALCIGFLELLQGLAATFDRECTMLPPTSHPDCSLQLTHAAGELRSARAADLEYMIQPLGTKFQPQALPPQRS